jgi:general secretion pathway protein N
MSTRPPTLDSRLSQVFQGAGGRVSGLTRGLPSGFGAAVASEASTRRWAVAGVTLGILAAVVVWAPAQWLASLVQHVTHDRIQLADARGTIWNGNAVAVLTGGAGSRDARSLPGRLQWQMRPHWTSGVITLTQGCCLRQGVDLVLRPGLNRLRIDIQPRSAPPLGVQPPPAPGQAATPMADTGHPLPGGPGGDAPWAQWPADWISGLGTPWNTMELGGALRLSSQGLALQWVQGRFSIEGRAELGIQDLRSRLSTLPRLGSYRLAISGDPAQAGTAQILLDTVDGALLLNAQGSWSAGGLRLRGDASARDADQGALANLLNILGRRDGNRSILSIG